MGKEYRFGETMITEEQLAKRAEELGRQISDDYKGEEVLCIGILKGSVMFMADLIKNIMVDTAIDFMAVSSYGVYTCYRRFGDWHSRLFWLLRRLPKR